MNNLADAVWIEWRKATRSRMPIFTALGFLLPPLGGAFFVFIYKDPEFARRAGLITAKANLMVGAADWPSYQAILAQAVGAGGILLFSLIESWVFGREFVDGTLKDLLAVPVPRSTILLAKFIVVAVWSAALTVIVCLAGLVLGALLQLPAVPISYFLQSGATLIVTCGLVFATVTPVAFFASVGRGYLAPMGVTFLLLLLTNIATVAGWGNYFPWAIPTLFAVPSATKYGALEPVSYVIVLLTGLVGILLTYLWWNSADQSR